MATVTAPGELTELEVGDDEVAASHAIASARNFLRQLPSPVREIAPYDAIGYIPPDPGLCFSGIWSTVNDEIEKTRLLHNHGDPSLLNGFNLEDFRGKTIEQLSGGQMFRAALALQYASRPGAWVLDRCFEWLERERIAWLREFFSRERALGRPVIEISAGRHWVLSDHLTDAANPKTVPVADVYKSEIPPVSVIPVGSADTGPVMELDGLITGYNDGFRIGPLSAAFQSGERVTLFGSNGAGKSTLAKSLAGLIPHEGILRINGVSQKFRKRSSDLTIYSFQNPDDQIFRETVGRELAETAKRRKAFSKPYLLEIARRLGIDTVLDSDPLNLPLSARRKLTIGAALVSRAPVVLLDEPSAFLGGWDYQCVLETLMYASLSGQLIIAICHDHAFSEAFSTRTLVLKEGAITEVMNAGDGVLRK